MRLLIPCIVLLTTTILVAPLPGGKGAANGLQQATVGGDAKMLHPGKSGRHADAEAAFESSGLLNRLEPFEF